jgi:hypothetical protein
MWQYTQYTQSPPELFSVPAQIPEYAVLFAKPFVLAQKLGILRGHLGFLRNRPNPLAERRKPDPQI